MVSSFVIPRLSLIGAEWSQRRHLLPPKMSRNRRSFAPAKLVHQFQDAFADFKEFSARFGNHFLRQQLLRRDGFEPGLCLVQMVERAFQIRDGEGVRRDIPVPRQSRSRRRQALPPLCEIQIRTGSDRCLRFFRGPIRRTRARLSSRFHGTGAGADGAGRRLRYESSQCLHDAARVRAAVHSAASSQMRFISSTDIRLSSSSPSRPRLRGPSPFLSRFSPRPRRCRHISPATPYICPCARRTPS